MIYAEIVLRELVTRPISTLVALVELPVTVQRSLKQANELMESSRRQLEAMQQQTESALQQAERMNDLLGRVVKLTEPIERAQRGGEYVGGRLKRAIFGEGEAERIQRAAEDAEVAAGDAERAAGDAEDAAERAETEAESATIEAESAAQESQESEEAQEAGAAAEAAADADGSGDGSGGVEVPDSATIRVIPNRPPPGEPDKGA